MAGKKDALARTFFGTANPLRTMRASQTVPPGPPRTASQVEAPGSQGRSCPSLIDTAGGESVIVEAPRRPLIVLPMVETFERLTDQAVAPWTRQTRSRGSACPP